MKNKFRRFLIRWLRCQVLGVALESDIPPEFVITHHGLERMRARVLGVKDYKEHLLAVWYYGSQPPANFKPDAASRGAYFKRFDYRHFDGIIYVFGLKRCRYGSLQKHLITVYNWT